MEYAYSQGPGRARRYVQQDMLACADEIWDLLQQGAVVLVCGNAATIAPGVRRSLLHIYRERTSTTDADAEAGWPGCARPAGTWRTSGEAEPRGRPPG